MLWARRRDVVDAMGGDHRAATHLAAMRLALVHALRTRSSSRPLLDDTATLHDYLRLDMAGGGVESVRVLFLDAACRLIREEAMWTGTVDAAPLYVREVVRRALDLDACGLIVAHNHPSGDPTPTRGDVAVTLELARAAATLGMSLHDHVVVARSGHFSMRAHGLLNDA